MRKYLIAFALVFGLAGYVSIRDEHDANQSAQESATALKSTISATPNENHFQQYVTYFFRWPNGTTTWAILFTLLAIAEQTKETARSAKAAEDSIPLQRQSAGAAKKSADVLIASERAWVTMKIDWAPGYSGIYAGEHTKNGTTKMMLDATVRMTYRNDGKTPAWITQRYATMKVIGENDALAKPIVGEEDIIDYGIVSLASGEEKWFDAPLQTEQQQIVGVTLTVIYGVVRYRTVIPKLTGESISGYSVSIGGTKLRPLEGPEWNGNS